MTKANKGWNPNYLSGCVQHALKLLPAEGVAIDLFRDAADDLECTNTYDCRAYRRQLNSAVTMLCSAIDEYNFELGTGFRQWHDQHAIKEPAYL